MNKRELVQILSSVIANSIDAMSQGGVLQVQIEETTHSEQGVQIVILDNGAGIQEEHLARISESFFTTKRNLDTGIGLWVAKQFTEKQRGQISITSAQMEETAGPL